MRAQIQNLINERKERLQAELPDLVRWEVQETIDDLEAAIRPQWVPVADRLPDTPRSVFVIDSNEDGYSIGYYLGGYGWGGCDINGENVTHWHEIDYPEPPESSQ